MSKGRKMALLGLTAIAATALLVSFTGEPGDDKKKKYQIIHHSNGEMVMHDTVIPMNSDYTAENFLSDKGIENENVEIIKMPSLKGMHSGMRNHMMIKEFREDNEMLGDGERVEIMIEIDDEGNKTTKKIVNGEEVELAEEDLERIEKHKRYGHKKMRMHDSEGKRKHGHHEENVEVIIDIDGNRTVKKFVDGEEVEMTEEDIKKMKMHKMREHHRGQRIDIQMDTEGESENVQIKIEVDEEGNRTIKKTVDGEEVELTEEELEGIEKFKKGHGDMMFIHEGEMNEMEEGHRMMIIKEMHCDSMDIEGFENFHHDMEFELRSDHREAKFEMLGEKEDFTIVLVTEDYDEDAEVEEKVKINKSIDSFEVYPNPNDGTFNVRFNQEEKLKTTIKVVDANGKVVFEDKLGKFSGNYDEEINLEKYGAGSYIISIERGGDVETRKIIIK